MAKLDLLIGVWDEGHREFEISLEGIGDEDLWVRPHPSLLSVGELAGHVTYYESRMTTGHLPDGQIAGPLVDKAFSYYTEGVGHPVNIAITAAELVAEVKRVHAEARAAVLSCDPDAEEPIPGRDGATWGGYLQYLGFHVAYHAGQVYSVRHLLGHRTEDN